MRARALAPLAFSLVLAAGAAHAAVFNVSALTNSINNGAGTGLPTLTVDLLTFLDISASPDDLWSAGPLPRWSDADGLTGNRFATGSDESGQPAGTLIGMNFGLVTIDGFAAPFGSLVGRIGTGPSSYRLLGTNFSGPAWANGVLTLYQWDTGAFDNSGSIAVTINSRVIPEPEVWALMIVGFSGVGVLLRHRRKGAVA